MSFKDKSGIELFTLKDVFEDSLPQSQDGSTVKISLERVVCKRFKNSGKVMEVSTSGLQKIKFWVILDCGAKEERVRPYELHEPRSLRPDRYIMASVGEDQDIRDVELEERGTALPDTYNSFDEAAEAVFNLCATARIMEE